MAKTYQSATLTICATHAVNHSIGCFVERDGLDGRPFALNLLDTEQGLIAPMVHLVASHIAEKNLRPRVLDSRAWALQEDLLSTRKLMCDSDGLRWECRVWRTSQQDPTPELATFATRMPPRLSLGTLTPFHEALRSVTGRRRMILDSNTVRDLASCWHRIVADYSQRCLTHKKDRLAAIAGVAEVIKRATRFTYVAGLFKELWWRDLLWHTSTFKSPDQRPKESSQIAPTWSWARWVRTSELHFPKDHFGSFQEGSFGKRQQLLTNTTELHLIRLQGTEFMRKGSTLKLGGQITQAVMKRWSAEKFEVRIGDTIDVTLANGHVQRSNLVTSFDSELEQGTPFWILTIIKDNGSKEEDPLIVASALLLRRRQCSEDERRTIQCEFVYQRVGMMQCDASWLDGPEDVAVIE